MGKSYSPRPWQALVFGAAMAVNSTVVAQDVALIGAAFIDLGCWQKVTEPTEIPRQGLRHQLTDSQHLKLMAEQLRDPIVAWASSKYGFGDPLTSPSRGGNYRTGDLSALIAELPRRRVNPGVDLKPCILAMEQLPVYKRLEGEKRSLENRVRNLEANYQSAADITTDLVQRLAKARAQMIALEEELARARATPAASEQKIVNGQTPQ